MANNNRFPRNGAKLHLPYFFQLHSFEEWLVRLPFWFVCDLKFIASNWHPHIPTQTVTLYSHYMEISQKVRSFFVSSPVSPWTRMNHLPVCLFSIFRFLMPHGIRFDYLLEEHTKKHSAVDVMNELLAIQITTFELDWSFLHSIL